MSNTLSLPSLKKWNLKSMKSLKNTFFSMVCIASRRRGKSELIRYVCESLKLVEEYDYIAVLSQSEESLDHYSNFIHGDLFIKDNFSAAIANIIKVSEKLETNDKKRKFLVIIDDVVGCDIKNSESIAQLYAMGRHYRMSVILIAQTLSNVNVCARGNSDVILIGHVNNAQEKESIMNRLIDGTFLPKEIRERGFRSKKEFYYQLFAENTANYQFMVIDQLSTKETNWQNILYTVKAEI